MRLGIVFLAIALLVVAVAADADLWKFYKQDHGLTFKNPADEWKQMKKFLAGLSSPHSRTKRNNFGDLPVKCGPNQEKIDGECHDV